MNEVDELEALKARVRALERQNRLVIIGVVIAGLLLAAASHVSSQPATLRARALELVGRQGRILLSADEGILRMLDSSGNENITLGLTRYLDPKSHFRVPTGLSISGKDEIISLGLGGGSLHTSTGLYISGKESAGLVITGKNIEFLSSLSATGLHIVGKGDNPPHIYLELPEDGKPYVGVRDAAGFEAVLGNVDLQTKSTGSTIQRSAASLTLFDSSGTVLWKTP